MQIVHLQTFTLNLSLYFDASFPSLLFLHTQLTPSFSLSWSLAPCLHPPSITDHLASLLPSTAFPTSSPPHSFPSFFLPSVHRFPPSLAPSAHFRLQTSVILYMTWGASLDYRWEFVTHEDDLILLYRLLDSIRRQLTIIQHPPHFSYGNTAFLPSLQTFMSLSI